ALLRHGGHTTRRLLTLRAAWLLLAGATTGLLGHGGHAARRLLILRTGGWLWHLRWGGRLS
ncbi:MAG: hypothetical protein NTX56_05510, partial [Proteobacteria bacterium]|nr:hypothetical protein [Pseudomonadota bacterium]